MNIKEIKFKNYLVNKFSLLQHINIFRNLSIFDIIKFHYMMTKAYIYALIKKNKYKIIDENKLRRTSETIFIFGSGYSLNSINSEEWNEIGKYDTLGFSGFVFQKWLNLNYFLVRGWGEGSTVFADVVKNAIDFSNLIKSNSKFEKSTIILQQEYFAIFGNTLLSVEKLPGRTNIFPYKSLRGIGLPSEKFQNGLRHAQGTLCDAINFAYCGGWKTIILAGVDLYDNRYFWLPNDKTWSIDYQTGIGSVSEQTNRGDKVNDLHSTVANGVIELIDNWNKHFKQKQINMYVLNPKSLLAKVLPVYKLNN